MPSVSLTLCGSVAVTGEGVSATSLSAKSLALLAYLALEPAAHSREELTALLWGEYPEEKARASLRQALMHLREVLPDCIHVDRTSVALAGDVECDVITFGRLAKDSPRAAAEILFAAESAAGFSVDELVEVLRDPDIRFTTTPENTLKYAEFMRTIGSIENQPSSWRELFFPEIHAAPGS